MSSEASLPIAHSSRAGSGGRRPSSGSLPVVGPGAGGVVGHGPVVHLTRTAVGVVVLALMVLPVTALIALGAWKAWELLAGSV